MRSSVRKTTDSEVTHRHHSPLSGSWTTPYCTRHGRLGQDRGWGVRCWSGVGWKRAHACTCTREVYASSLQVWVHVFLQKGKGDINLGTTSFLKN